MFYDGNIAPSTTTKSYDVTAHGSHPELFTVRSTRRASTHTAHLVGVSDVNACTTAWRSLQEENDKDSSCGQLHAAKATDGGQVPASSNLQRD